MTRLPFIPNEDLTSEQQEVWNNVVNGKRGDASRFINAEGALVGPFNAAMHAANTGRKVVALGEALRFDTAIDNRLLELAVCMVGAHWKSNFEWYAHSRLAVQAGVSAEAVAAIEKGDRPELARADEAAVYEFTRMLLSDGRVSDAVYGAAQAEVGDQGMVELTQLIGYYCLISLTLNTFQVDLPPGETPAWPY
ncbi:MAG: carboxymuconolactone decarboxylase family protein [Actinomycetota bacterium]|nr:carboxymuconolactone decarboxylase family protein [Actinomycetota bacterium]